MLIFRLFLIGCITLATGCRTTSRWAMDNPTYARKYSRPYEDRGWKKHQRMGKQLVDARFVEGEGGLYVNGEYQGDPTHLGGEIGMIGFPQSWLSARIGVAGLLREDDAGGSLAGVDGGLRIFAPTRLAPFVGFGGFAGYREEEITIPTSSLNSSGPIVATRSEGDGLAAIYPEIGVGFWINGHWQVTASSRYYVTTNGRSDDHWTFGVGLTYLLGDHADELPVPLPGAREIDEIVAPPPTVVPRSEVLTPTGVPVEDNAPVLKVGPFAQELPIMNEPELP